jgi:predicted pyridoxine 5'-phosphate oxidase superfamily flavin-nucleotide-binding protein
MLPRDANGPFHAGEIAAQARVGLDARMDAIGRRIIRDFMPDEHRELFTSLPWMILGSLDAGGRPWASVLTGPPGFVRSPDARTLALDALPVSGDPAADHLAAGAPVGLLGIQPETRRRNRANGEVTRVGAGGFVVDVRQSFGNCPKYIHARAPEIIPERRGGAVRAEGPLLSPAAVMGVRGADTFFIASSSLEAHGRANGVDVSHRGGKAGFVKVTEERGRTVLTWPDFRGNFLFNTIGNLEAYPFGGVLFVDFESGDLLSLTGEAEVLWDSPMIAAFAGAERIVRLRVSAGVRIEQAMPLRWSPPRQAMEVAQTGAW